MVWRIVALCVALMLCNVAGRAQFSDNTITLSREEKVGNSFYAYFLLDSFSNAGDSVQASACLMRVDPYYLMFQTYTPENFDKRLSGYRLTARAKHACRNKFTAVFRAQRSDAYTAFRAMYEEDQDVRNRLDKCRDSLSTAVYERKMSNTDSVHSGYLYKYVLKHGWPKLSDGSLYANIIAIHDPGHYKEYLPFIRKAVLAGQIDEACYNNLLNRVMKPGLDELLTKFKNKSVFDISYVLKGDTPSNTRLQQMKQAIKENKRIRYFYFVYQGGDERQFYRYFSGREGHSHGIYGWDTYPYWIAWDLMVRLNYYQQELLPSEDQPPYQFTFLQSNASGKSLTMYLLY